MRNDDGSIASTGTPSDPDWPAQHPALDAALVKAIRAPVAEAEFDREVWARIRAEAAVGSSTSSVHRQRSGAPFWLNALNAIAIVIVAVIVAVALGTAAQPAAHSARAAVVLVEHSPNWMRMALLIVSGTSLWLGLRQTPWARTIGL